MKLGMHARFHLDMDKVKKFAEETGAELLEEGLQWPGPDETPENSLIIPYSDLGRTSDGLMYRMSLSTRSYLENTLLSE